MAKESSGEGPKGSNGSSSGSKGSSTKGSGSTKGSSTKGTGPSKDSGSTKGSGSTKDSGVDSKSLGNVGWGGGSKGPSFGGGSYSPSTDFGKGDTGSSFGNFSGGSKGGSSGGGGSKVSDKPAKGKLDSAFQNFRPDTPQNTQIMGGQMYVRDKGTGDWRNYKTGQSIEGRQLDRLAYHDTLKQNNMMTRGYDDLTAIKGWFKSLNPFADDEQPTSEVSPLGGWASYGGAVPGVEDTRGFFNKLGDTFQKFGWGMQDAPLKTLSDLASNPLVSAVGAFTGTLPAMAAIKGASALKDLATDVISPTEAAQSLATTAVTHTPVGEALGEFKGLASAAITGDPAKIAGGVAGFAGGKVGTSVGQAIGSALTSNPYGAAIGAMVGGTVGSYGGQQLAVASSGQPQVKGPTKESSKDTEQSSPLVSKGDTTVASAPSSEADPLKYIREMELPYYGPQYQVNPYGIPNTYMMGA